MQHAWAGEAGGGALAGSGRGAGEGHKVVGASYTTVGQTRLMIAINPVTVGQAERDRQTGEGDRDGDGETDRHANSATSKDTKGYCAAAANNAQASSRNRAKLTDHQQAGRQPAALPPMHGQD